MNSSPLHSENKPHRWRMALRVLLAILVLAALYFSYGWYWQSSAVQEILQIQESFQSEASREWTPEQRTQWGQRIQYLQKNLTSESKKELANQSNKQGMKRVEAQFDKIFSMPRAEMVRELDQMINQTEKTRVDHEKRMLDLRNKGIQTAPRSKDPHLDNQGLSNLLDQTNPELRAKFHLFVQEINKRRQERNLPPWQPFRGD